MNETQLENLCLDWFAENGWEVVHGIDIAPESSNPLRKDYKQILLEADVQAAFERLNPHLPASCFAACSNTGAKDLHGPHQSAQTSSSNGRSPLIWLA